MADGVAGRMARLGGPDLARGPEVADPWFRMFVHRVARPGPASRTLFEVYGVGNALKWQESSRGLR